MIEIIRVQLEDILYDWKNDLESECSAYQRGSRCLNSPETIDEISKKIFKVFKDEGFCGMNSKPRIAMRGNTIVSVTLDYDYDYSVTYQNREKRGCVYFHKSAPKELWNHRKTDKKPEPPAMQSISKGWL